MLVRGNRIKNILAMNNHCDVLLVIHGLTDSQTALKDTLRIASNLGNRELP